MTVGRAVYERRREKEEKEGEGGGEGDTREEPDITVNASVAREILSMLPEHMRLSVNI